MAEQSQTLIRIVRVIDRFTDTTGSWVAWLSVPLVLAVSYEVIARYFFNAPTLWAFDVTYMLYGALFMLGAAYALHKGAHIRTDFLWEKWSVRTRGLIDAIAYVVFFFPSLIVLFFVSFHETFYAWQIMETSEQTAWRPLLWPFKAVVPVTCLLLLIQGVSETVKSLYAARAGIELEHKEKVEI
jgi:TRAP-type mannitol/chloroaromatic compound transport system permease small subunit